ncbi:MAG: hypothetical protein ABR975_14305 [Vulcanimicrobiaceae bacterium]
MRRFLALTMLLVALPSLAAADGSPAPSTTTLQNFAVEERAIEADETEVFLAFDVVNTGAPGAVKLGGAYMSRGIPSMEYEPHIFAGPKGSTIDRLEVAREIPLPSQGAVRLSIPGPFFKNDELHVWQHGPVAITFFAMLKIRSGSRYQAMDFCRTYLGHARFPFFDCTTAFEKTTIP